MRSRTDISIEYAPCGLTAQGTWRRLNIFNFPSQETAERALEEYKESFAKIRNSYPGYEAYKVMKRTVVVTLGEWEDA